MARTQSYKTAALLVSGLIVSGCSTSSQQMSSQITLDSILEQPATRIAKRAISPEAKRVPGVRIYDNLGSDADKLTNMYQGNADVITDYPTKVLTDDRTFNLDLRNIDVRDLVSLILGDLLKRNYLLDENVQGKISLYTPTELSVDDLMPLLIAALNSQKADLLESAGLIRIVASSTETGRAIGSIARTDILPIFLKNTSAADMRKTLLPVAKDLVEISVDEPNNILILSGNPKHMTGLSSLVQTLDIKSLNGKSFGLYPLRNAEARDIISELKSIFRDGSPIQFVEIKRLNAVLVATQTSQYLKKAEKWIETLDRADGVNRRHIYVYPALSGQPQKLADTLAALLVGLVPAQQSDNPSPAGLFGRETGQGLLTPILENNQSSANADSDNSPGATKQSPGTEDALRIVADNDSNQLFVFGTESEWDKIQAILRKLDKEPQQVMIEATIVEVSLNDSLRYGLQFMLGSGNSNFNLPGFEGGGLSSGSANSFNYIFDNGRSAQVILDALSSMTDVNVISSPRLMVLGEETATLQIGDQVPIALQSAVPIEAGDSRIINTIEFRDTGVILRVTPHIGADGTILIDVDQEISDVAATTTSNIDSPTIRQRRVSSKISVQDGETVAFAGLTRNSTSDIKNGIPIARELPLIGPLFGSTDQVTTRTELLVLLTPRLIQNLDDARAVTNELKGKLNDLLSAADASPSVGGGDVSQ